MEIGQPATLSGDSGFYSQIEVRTEGCGSQRRCGGGREVCKLSTIGRREGRSGFSTTAKEVGQPEQFILQN